MPENTVYVGRPTKWGNYSESLYKYDGFIRQMIEIGGLDISEIIGKDLACWCAIDEPCHADVLLEIANEEYDE